MKIFWFFCAIYGFAVFASSVESGGVHQVIGSAMIFGVSSLCIVFSLKGRFSAVVRPQGENRKT